MAAQKRQHLCWAWRRVGCELAPGVSRHDEACRTRPPGGWRRCGEAAAQPRHSSLNLDRLMISTMGEVPSGCAVAPPCRTRHRAEERTGGPYTCTRWCTRCIVMAAMSHVRAKLFADQTHSPLWVCPRVRSSSVTHGCMRAIVPDSSNRCSIDHPLMIYHASWE